MGQPVEDARALSITKSYGRQPRFVAGINIFLLFEALACLDRPRQILPTSSMKNSFLAMTCASYPLVYQMSSPGQVLPIIDFTTSSSMKGGAILPRPAYRSSAIDGPSKSHLPCHMPTVGPSCASSSAMNPQFCRLVGKGHSTSTEDIAGRVPDCIITHSTVRLI